MHQFAENMTLLKQTMKGWNKKFKERMQAELKEVEATIGEFFSEGSAGSLAEVDFTRLRDLGFRKWLYSIAVSTQEWLYLIVVNCC